MTYPNDFIDKIICGDCLEVMATMPDNSVDACVTDPPYELGFMGKAWDKCGIAYNVDLWREVLRVLKPGGHLLAFGGSRTYHRMACAVEDAGFEIRDQIMWVYGSGFPKSLDISKAIDKMAGMHKPELVPTKQGNTRHDRGVTYATEGHAGFRDISLPATPEAREWSGWGTALKPAHEPIVVARKPLSEKTVAANVLKWGTGGLNIDGCRVATKDKLQILHNPTREKDLMGNMKGKEAIGRKIEFIDSNLGRFPANFIHDGSNEVLGLMPETKTHSTGKHSLGEYKTNSIYGDYGVDGDRRYNSDSGSAARFFYCAKASKKERDMGCEGMPLKRGGMRSETSGQHITRRDGKDPSPTSNHHPTVKPLALMRYLVKLVTREGQTVIDPFAGSGSTLIACKELKRKYIGIDTSQEYCEIAECRIKYCKAKEQLEML